jgi:hypothetical protein
MNIQKFLVLSLLVFIGSCKEKPTTPIDPDAALPAGRRDYTWTVDTLRFQSAFIYPLAMWGSSPNDVWMIASASNLNERLWHYDGQHWINQELSNENYFDPLDIYGLAANDIWIVATEGRFLHYDGQSWSLFAEFSPLRTVEYPYMYCTGIWGDAPNNVYAVGFVQSATDGNKFKANIMHFDGTRWDSVPIPELKLGFSRIYKSVKESNTYYLQAERDDSTGTTNFIYEFDGQHLQVIFQSTQARISFGRPIDGKIYFADGKSILKYINGKFQVWLSPTGLNIPIYNVFGRNSKDLLIASTDELNPRQGVIRHFDGNDIQILFNQLPVLPTGNMIFTNDVFFGAWGLPNIANTPIVIHGKLKN